MVAESQLIAAIDAAPDEPAGYAVYGDWLVEHGEPLGEIVALQHAADAEPDPERRAALESLVDGRTSEHEAKAFGQLRASAARWHSSWRFGFMRALVVETRFGAELVAAIAAAPAARFLHDLVLEVRAGGRTSDGLLPATTDPVVTLVHTGLPPALKRLDLVVEVTDGESNWGDYDLTAFYPLVPHLEELTLNMPDVVGTLVHPRLRELAIDVYEPRHLADLDRALAPSLESLVLRFGSLDALRELEIPGAPRLTELTLAHSTDSDYDALASAPLLSRLRTLALESVLAPELVPSFLEIAPALAHLDTIRVTAGVADEALLRVFGSRLVLA